MSDTELGKLRSTGRRLVPGGSATAADLQGHYEARRRSAPISCAGVGPVHGRASLSALQSPRQRRRTEGPPRPSGSPQARRRTYIAGWRRSAQQRPFQWPRPLPCMSLHEVLVEDPQSSTAVARAPTEAGQGRLKANMAKAARKIFKSTQSCAALQETSL